MRDSNRLTELDALRGIAAVMVVLFHATENLPDRDLLILRILRGTPLRPILDGRQAVIFFFVLSGLALTRALLAPQPPGYLTYVLRRVIRLCVPALAAVLLSAVFYFAFHVEGAWPDAGTWLATTSWTHAPSLTDVSRQVLLAGVDGDYHLDCVLWSLAQELRLSAVLPLVVMLAAAAKSSGYAQWDQPGARLLMMAGAMLVGLALADHGLSDQRFGGGDAGSLLVSFACRVIPVVMFVCLAAQVSLLSVRGLDVVRYFPLAGCFVAGLVVGFHLDAGGTIMLGPTMPVSFLATLYFLPCFLAGAALSLGALDQFAPGPRERTLCLAGAAILIGFDNYFATTAASLLIILIAMRPGLTRTVLRTRPLAFLGRISFSLYLVHVPLFLAMSHGLHGIVPAGVILALWLPLTLPAAWVLHCLIELPSHRIARHIGRSSKPAAIPVR